MNDLPLEGFTVLDLTKHVRGAYCTKLLADYGATVLKVESPAGGPIRKRGPFALDDNPLETGVLHLYLNTNKLSLAVDLHTKGGKDVVRRLAEGCDALVFDGLEARLSAWGLARADRESRAPRLVTTLVTPFGQNGPYAEYPATNLTEFAAGGQMNLTGDPDREPLKNGGEQAEFQGGLNAFSATLAGLLAAQLSGAGDTIDISVQECMASALELAMPAHLYLGREGLSQRRGNIASSILGIYPCADGHIGVHAMPRNFPALARLMDAEWMIEDPDFSTSAARVQHDDELRAMIYAWAADQEKRDVYRRAGEGRAPVAFVHGMQDVLESPQLQAREYFHDVEHPVAGVLSYPGPPLRLGDGSWRPGRAPLLGEHTAAVLRERLNMDDAEIAGLRGEGAIS